jgi:hypothetical protein
VLRFEEALERYRKRRLTAAEAGEVLGMSGRNFRRLIMRYDEDGAEGLRDRRHGRASPRRVLEAQPPAQPPSRVVVERPIRRSDGAY